MRRQFILPQDDVAFLEGLALPWETVIDQGMHWLLVHNYPICQGYTTNSAIIAIKVETGYPRSALDMAYFFPALFRRDGIPINAISIQMIDAKVFQRWSRHRTAQNPWREGIDDISTHISLIDFWFKEEFIKKPNGITT